MTETTQERTFFIVKPDAVERGLIGDIILRIERKGLKIEALDMRTPTKELAQKHYEEHVGKPFFDGLVDFITSGPVVAGVLSGPRAVQAWRQLAGGTDPVEQATPGSIRGDYALEKSSNVVHGSDSVESAEREIELWFPQ